MDILMHPDASHNQKYPENSGKHPGILTRFDIAEDAANEAANSAEEPDGEKDHASQNQYVADRSVHEMVHPCLLHRTPENRAFLGKDRD